MLDRFVSVSSRFLKSQRFNKKLSTYFLFFLISFSFWFLSMLSKKHETTIDIPISFSNFSADLIVPESVPENINIRVKAPGFSIIFFNLFNSSVLDLNVSSSKSKPIKGGKEIFWLMNAKRSKISNVLGSSMEILDVSPSRLGIYTQNKALKRVPVKLQENIRLKSEYWLSELPQLLPDSVTIYANQLQLDTIDYVLTKKLDVSNLSDNQEFIINLEQIKGVSCKISSVSVIVSVGAFVEETIIKPITIKNLKKGYSVKLFPENIEVTVRAPRETYLLLKTDFFNAEVDVREMSSENNVLDVLINNLPSNIKLQMVYPERVEYLLIKE